MSRPRRQHTTSEMSGTVSANTLATVRFLVIPNQNAGASLLTERSGGDRAQEVNNGSRVGNITLDITERGATSAGVLEVCVVKCQRQHAIPAVGTDPIPSTADVLATGLQQNMRGNTPGWVLKSFLFPYTAEMPVVRKISINLAKFKMATWRDGDYLAVLLFNRGGGAIIVDHTARYYEYL